MRKQIDFGTRFARKPKCGAKSPVASRDKPLEKI
jgi:hypothetical protein